MPKNDVLTYLSARNPVRTATAVTDPAALERSFRLVIAQPADGAPRLSGRSRLVRLVQVGVPVAAAAAAAVVLTTGGGAPGTSFPSAVAELADAASVPTAVVHTIVTGDDVEGSPGARREEWASVDESVIRYRTTQPSGSYTDVLLREDAAGHRHLTLYRSDTNTLYRYPVTDSPPARTDPSALSINRIGNYAAAIHAGKARVTGEEVVNGTTAYRVEERVPGPAGGDTQVWLVAKDASQPRLLRIERPCAPADRPCAATEFAAYDISNDRSALQMSAHPGAKVVDVAPPTRP